MVSHEVIGVPILSNNLYSITRPTPEVVTKIPPSLVELVVGFIIVILSIEGDSGNSSTIVSEDTWQFPIVLLTSTI